jgi:alginate O-acetyltransferase complex protein AlgI
MLFNSWTFWLFFCAIWVCYSRLKLQGQNVLLLVASNFFYGWWDWRFLPLIWVSILVDFNVGREMGLTTDASRRRLLLAVSLVANLGVLFFFKYLNFFAGEYCRLIGLFGEHHDIPLWIKTIVLPIGISFYTFQTLSYTVDVYRGRTPPVKRLFDYALYHSFFPQLLAGPIERPGALMPQLLSPRPELTWDRFSEGFYHLITGFFRKMVADNLAMVVNHVYALPSGQVSGWEVLVGTYAFAFQIYCDFSGYSSIAQGIARWLGFELMWNFRLPYFATSPQTFWQRWHISLSTWLRDYLFMPLMTMRWLKGVGKVYVVTLLVQLASGVWHGANWTFLAWGLLHGFYLCSQLWLSRRGWFKEPGLHCGWAKRVPFMLITFHLMFFGMILFRAENIGQAGEFVIALLTRWSGSNLTIYGFAYIAFFIIPLMAFECWLEQKQDVLALLKVRWQWRAVAYVAMALMIWFLPPENTNEFIYFQF